MRNRVLVVDLSNGQFFTCEVDSGEGAAFLGGAGVGWRLAAEHLRQGLDPFADENVIILSAGALVGTLAPGASKLSAVSKYPTIATEDGKYFVGSSTGGGRRFPPMLRMAGYDHLVIRGRAARPVYLRIVDDRVTLEDAREFWGKSSDQTADQLIDETGTRSGVLTIGPAGENRVRFALAFMDKTNSLGRAGLGAIMGAKNLKAVVVAGTKGVPVEWPDRFRQAVDEARSSILSWPKREHWLSIGMGAGWGTFIHTQYPGKWTKQEWDSLYGEAKRLETLDRVMGCNSCLIPCRVRWQIPDGDYAGEVGLGSPYGKSATSGQLLDIKDHRKTIHLVKLANDAGIDFYTCTRMIDFVTKLYQDGRLTKGDTGGLELQRDYDSYLKYFDMIVHRQGFGDTLAEGWLGLKQRLGLDPQDYWYGGICKGVDFIYDGRASNFHPMMMTFFTRERPHHGGSHTLTNSPGNTIEDIRSQIDRLGLPRETVDRIFTPSDHAGPFNTGRYAVYMEDWMRVKNALGLCSVYTFFNILSGAQMAALHSGVAGREISGLELMRGGERISNLAKLINMKEGFSRHEDQVPRLWLRPMESPEGTIVMQDYFKTKTLTLEDVEKTLDDYYEERGWDQTTGTPGAGKLNALGLDRWI